MADKNSSDHHFGLTVTLSVEALKALLIVNGGAATALIALTGRAQGGPDYSVAVLLFGLGALLNAGTLAVGYFSQLAYANHRLAHEQQNDTESTKMLKRHQVTQYAAIVMVVASLAASGFAMYRAFQAL